MVIEAGVVAGYLVAWAVRKARRVGGRLDEEADSVIDASLNRLHEVVAVKLGGHPALAELLEEGEASEESGRVGGPIRQQVELALAAAAGEDDGFGQAITELVGHLRELERAAGSRVIAGPGSTVFTGNAEVKAESGGIAFGLVAGGVHLSQAPPDPSQPGRSSH